jgi:hypothetical protein
MTSRRFLAYWACAVSLVAAVGGCEHGWDLDVTITVPADLQTGFTATKQGRVYFEGLQAVICLPSAESLTIHFKRSGFGCADQRTAVARLIPYSGADQQLECGVDRKSWPTTTEEVDRAIAEASVVLFPPETECGLQTVNLVLAAIRGSAP